MRYRAPGSRRTRTRRRPPRPAGCAAAASGPRRQRAADRAGIQTARRRPPPRQRSPSTAAPATAARAPEPTPGLRRGSLLLPVPVRGDRPAGTGRRTHRRAGRRRAPLRSTGAPGQPDSRSIGRLRRPPGCRLRAGALLALSRRPRRAAAGRRQRARRRYPGRIARTGPSTTTHRPGGTAVRPATVRRRRRRERSTRCAELHRHSSNRRG